MTRPSALLPLAAAGLVVMTTAGPRAASSAPVRAAHGMVGSSELHATQAGIEILKAGGNAVDAAVATGFALAVTHPEAGNLGGGGFMVIRLASGKETTIDYREKAPARATRDMFLDEHGSAVDERSRSGPLACGVPGSVAGLALALLRSLAIRPLNWLIIFVVDLFRALPPLVIIVLIYFGLPAADISPSGFVSTWLSLALVLMAFAEEIFWAGILSVPKGQWEAARSTGLSFLATLTYVVLPQALRLTVPPITNRTVAITKNTALGTVIGVGEILNQATTAQSFSGNATPLMMGAIAYVILFIPVVVLGRFLETRFAWRRV